MEEIYDVLERLRETYNIHRLSEVLDGLRKRYASPERPPADALPAAVLCIKSREDWLKYRQKILDTAGIDRFLQENEHLRNVKSYEIAMTRYKREAEKYFQLPEEIEENVSELAAEKVVKLIERRLVSISVGCYRGLNGTIKVQEEQKFYQRFLQLLAQYFQDIHVIRQDLCCGDSIRGKEEMLRIIAAKPTAQKALAGTIDEIEFWPHVLRYVDEDGEIGSLYIEGQCVVYTMVRGNEK